MKSPVRRSDQCAYCGERASSRDGEGDPVCAGHESAPERIEFVTVHEKTTRRFKGVDLVSGASIEFRPVYRKPSGKSARFTRIDAIEIPETAK